MRKQKLSCQRTRPQKANGKQYHDDGHDDADDDVEAIRNDGSDDKQEKRIQENATNLLGSYS